MTVQAYKNSVLKPLSRRSSIKEIAFNVLFNDNNLLYDSDSDEEMLDRSDKNYGSKRKPCLWSRNNQGFRHPFDPCTWSTKVSFNCFYHFFYKVPFF